MTAEPRYIQTSIGFSKYPEVDPARVLEQIRLFPEMRYMGSKRRLLPWIHQVLSTLDFDSALDPFCGSSCVAYLLKCMGKRVVASDFLNFASTLARATVENNRYRLSEDTIKKLLSPSVRAPRFIQKTFEGIFYTREDLRFLDRIAVNILALDDRRAKALAMSALVRACLKRQPRGVFTVSGNLDRYDDGRRDLHLSLKEHFLEQVDAFNRVVFDNGRDNRALTADVFEVDGVDVDLVYLDPPYVPRSDDNCYIKRYHFLEGLSCYWKDLEIDYSTKVRKIPKRFTPFSYRRTAVGAFDQMFAKFRKSIIVLSYSSNGYPDLEQLESVLRRHKSDIRVYRKPHRYHFGTHSAVHRSAVTEYLIVGA